MDINTSKFIFDPKKPDFEERMLKRSPVFDLPNKRKQWLTYITLVYDMQSEIRRNIRDYTQRKLEGAQLAGFKIDPKTKRFPKDIEEVLLGEYMDFNRAVNQFVYYNFSNDYKLLYVLEEKYDLEIREHSSSLKVLTKNERENLTKTNEQIHELVEKLFGGSESINMLKALYQGIDNVSDRMPRKEHEMEEFERNGLELWSPFPDYKPEPLKFVGDKIL